ncbi:hypothetical protein PspLS_09818 [Pyricularia sp. CBS 133598]|nr:hypothetical protein PspLS_09818 [Pyricularia sp. CBS 133598]
MHSLSIIALVSLAGMTVSGAVLKPRQDDECQRVYAIFQSNYVSPEVAFLTTNYDACYLNGVDQSDLTVDGFRGAALQTLEGLEEWAAESEENMGDYNTYYSCLETAFSNLVSDYEAEAEQQGADVDQLLGETLTSEIEACQNGGDNGDDSGDDGYDGYNGGDDVYTATSAAPVTTTTNDYSSPSPTYISSTVSSAVTSLGPEISAGQTGAGTIAGTPAATSTVSIPAATSPVSSAGHRAVSAMGFEAFALIAAVAAATYLL